MPILNYSQFWLFRNLGMAQTGVWGGSYASSIDPFGGPVERSAKEALLEDERILISVPDIVGLLRFGVGHVCVSLLGEYTPRRGVRHVSIVAPKRRERCKSVSHGVDGMMELHVFTLRSHLCVFR